MKPFNTCKLPSGVFLNTVKTAHHCHGNSTWQQRTQAPLYMFLGFSIVSSNMQVKLQLQFSMSLLLGFAKTILEICSKLSAGFGFF